MNKAQFCKTTYRSSLTLFAGKEKSETDKDPSKRSVVFERKAPERWLNLLMPRQFSCASRLVKESEVDRFLSLINVNFRVDGSSGVMIMTNRRGKVELSRWLHKIADAE